MIHTGEKKMHCYKKNINRLLFLFFCLVLLNRGGCADQMVLDGLATPPPPESDIEMLKSQIHREKRDLKSLKETYTTFKARKNPNSYTENVAKKTIQAIYVKKKEIQILED